MIFAFSTILGCSQKNTVNNKLTLKEADAIINNYLVALTMKDVKLLNEFGTNKYTKSFNNEGISLLKDTLESAKLIKAEIRTNDNKKALIDTEVEIICYENSSPTGDWIPGKSISTKSFELINVNGKWKVNGWGVY